MKQNIIKIILGIFLFTAAQNSVFAQAEDFKNSSPEERAELLTEWMKDELLLDSNTVKSVYAINLKYAKKNMELMNSGGSKLSKFRKFRSSSKDKDEELKRVLSRDQYEVYQKRKEELREIMKEKIKERKSQND